MISTKKANSSTTNSMDLEENLDSSKMGNKQPISDGSRMANTITKSLWIYELVGRKTKKMMPKPDLFFNPK
jgi:hypothetical protein